MQCIDVLRGDAYYDCAVNPLRGIENRVLLINFKDIDRRRTYINSDKTVIERLFLLYKKRGYLFEGKRGNFTGNQKYSNGYLHEVQIRIYNVNRENLKRIQEVTRGRFVAIIETKNNTEDYREAFEVLGFDSGMRLTSMQRDYKESSVKLTFGTGEVKEIYPLYKWLEGDYHVTKQRFEKRLTEGELFKIFDETFDETFE